MDPRRRALLMVGIFVGLLALHVWLLYRRVVREDWVLAGWLVAAIALFGWRIVHYGNVYRGAIAGRPPKGPTEERRQIRTMVPLLAGLLVLHAWLITITWAEGEVLFTALLLLAVAVFVARIGFYVWRLSVLRRGTG
ncbi:MAG TPA: hypothetical protein VGR51_00605 [Thermoplasmata archaeon]|nr:hypothetical protein [Thermoplasmata archaeon]